MHELIPHALAAGVNYFSFWNMTVGEIQLYLSAYADEQNRTRKQKAADLYSLACLVAKAFAGKLRSLYEEFPKLFEEESETAELDAFISRMFDFAAGHNAMIDKTGGDS